jgi:hypothetical protein
MGEVVKESGKLLKPGEGVQQQATHLCDKEGEDSNVTAIHHDRGRTDLPHVPQGAAYNKDNQAVFQLLTQMLSGTGAWTWTCMFETAKNGKGSYKVLRNHYDGPGQIEKQLGYARNILANTYYQLEKQFRFKSYVTKLSEAFEFLKENNVKKAEREKVD